MLNALSIIRVSKLLLKFPEIAFDNVYWLLIAEEKILNFFEYIFRFSIIRKNFGRNPISTTSFE